MSYARGFVKILCVMSMACSAAGPIPPQTAENTTRREAMTRIAVSSPSLEARIAVARRVEAPAKRVQKRRVKTLELNDRLIDKSVEILHGTRGQDFGHQTRFEMDGKHYAAVIEHHYHEPGGELTPWGWHRGISLFVFEG